MKVLVLVPDLKQPGGVTNYYKCLELDKQNNIDYFDVNTTSTDLESNPELSNKFIMLKKAINLPIIYFKFICTAYKYNIIHVNPSLNFKSFIRDSGFVILSGLMSKKIIIFFRGWEDEFEQKVKHNPLLKLLFNISFSRSHFFIVLGRIFQEKLINLGVSQNKRFFIESTIADSNFLINLDLDKKVTSIKAGVKILFISRILKEKGVYIAIDTAVKLDNAITDRDVTLFVAGDGEELDKAKEYVEKNKYNNIKFTGYVEKELKMEMLVNSHLMLFPSYYGEGLPNCILEGMLYAMPIISRNNAGIPDIIENNINGYLLDSLDPDDFTDKCIKIINNQEIYQTMAKKNHEKAIRLYTTDAVKLRLLNIYNIVMYGENDRYS